MRNREIKKNFWVNEEERDMLAKKSKDAGMSESEYFRKRILGYELKEKPDDKFYQCLKYLRNISNNINQLSKKANALGFIDKPLYDKEKDKLDKLVYDLKKKYLLNEMEIKND